MIEMNEELDVLKSSLQSVNELADIKRNPVVEAVLMPMVKAFPVIGDMIDSTINVRIDEFQNKKEQELVNYILKDKYTITSEMVNDVEFIVNFAKTKEAVCRLATNDKVKFFGNLIRNGYLSGEHIEVNEFDEYMNILDIMSYREIKCLIDFYLHSVSLEGEQKEIKWGLFKKKEEYIDVDIEFLFRQLLRTGFINEYFSSFRLYEKDNMEYELGCMENPFRGFEINDSFKRFYEMTLKS